MRKVISMAITGFCLLFVFTSLSFAQPVPLKEITYEKVNPNDGFSYIQKRIEEKVKLFILSFSTLNKEKYYQELSNRRLAELKYVIEKDDKNNFEKATIRYSTTIGEWAEFILKNKLDDEKDSAVSQLNQHLPIIEQLMSGYDTTTAEWRFVKQDFDYIKIYTSKLQK